MRLPIVPVVGALLLISVVAASGGRVFRDTVKGIDRKVEREAVDGIILEYPGDRRVIDAARPPAYAAVPGPAL